MPPKANSTEQASLYADNERGPVKGSDSVQPTTPAPKVVPKPTPAPRAATANERGPGSKVTNSGT